MGGPTDIDQLILLCPRHHRQHHAGEFGIAMVDGRPRIHSDAVPVPRPPPEDPPRLPERRPTEQDGPSPSAVWRCCEPLTHYGLDVLVAPLQDAVAASTLAPVG